MKKVWSILLILLMIFSLCACADTEPDWTEPSLSLSQRAGKAVQEELRVYIYIAYPVQEFPEVTTVVTELGGDQYEVTGTVSFADAYGKAYSGTYEADVEYLRDVNNFQVTYTLDI